MTALMADGLVHSVGFYRSTEEFVATFVPFCRDGQERGDATVVRLGPAESDMLRDALGEAAGVDFLAHDDEYASAPAAMASALRLLDSYVERGAKRVRLLGQLPDLVGLARDTWLRYEAAANRVLAKHPVDALCAVDRRTISDTVHDELLRTHHVVVSGDGVAAPSGHYEEPERYVANRAQEVHDDLEVCAPALEATDPTPATARHALGRLAGDMHLDDAATDSLLLAVSEVLNNAILYGGKPIVVRAWGETGRVVVAVRDPGDGPHDPFAGLVPVEPGRQVGGLGLWIAHQLCPEIALSITDDGFTVRLAAGHAGNGDLPRDD